MCAGEGLDRGSNLAFDVWPRPAAFAGERVHGLAVARYRGKLRGNARAQAQDAFMSGEARLMVATQAFGMGIDKPDIGFVVHWNFPESLESYYQEAGRAGRDGEPAQVVLFYRLEDKRIRSFFLRSKHPRRHEALAVITALTASGSGTKGYTMQALADAASLSLRRASVIAAVLENMELVRRSGKMLTLRRRFGDPELERFLATFEARYDDDRERIDNMMRYGQTTRCRMQFLRGSSVRPRARAAGTATTVSSRPSFDPPWGVSRTPARS